MRLSGQQIRALRIEMAKVFAGPGPERQLWLLLYEELDVQLSDIASANGSFQNTLTEALARLNSVNRIPALMNVLEARYPDAINLHQVIAELRRATQPSGPCAAARLHALEQAFLLLDGVPFINRSRLRQLLPEILDPSSTARVGVIKGTSLAGKTWSRHLILAYCRAAAQVRPLVLDMERIQPGNDPVIVWTELLRRLMPGRPQPAPPAPDTKGGLYILRLVEDVCTYWDAWKDPEFDEKPWPLIVFDHLEKHATAAVGPAVVDFAEALAVAAVERDFKDARVLLLGFPRTFTAKPELNANEVAPHEIITPLTCAEIKRYLDEVGKAIGRGPPSIIAEAAEKALQEVDTKIKLEERRMALSILSAKIARDVSVLAKVT